MTKARKGKNTGGRIFGYDNIRRPEGVEFQINAEQAEIVRRIFREYVGGSGYRTIARKLNAEGIASPRAGSRGTGSWSDSQIRAMLTSHRYIGLLEWGEFRKGYRGGTKVRERQPATSILTVERPDLRIIDPETWARAVARHELRAQDPRSSSRKGPRFVNLLTGFARCAECGGPMQLESSKVGQTLVKVYSCNYARKRGTCSNKMQRPAEPIDSAVIEWIQSNVLREEVVIEVLGIVRERLAERAKSSGADLVKLGQDKARLQKEITNLADSLADMGRSKVLTERLAQKEGQLEQIVGRLEAARAAPGAIDVETRRLEATARQRLGDLRALLKQHPTQARKAIEALMPKDGRLTFEAVRGGDGPRYKVTGKIATEASLRQLRARCVLMRASPRGHARL
ncbi:MAG: recombinase family protein [Deltaproteobacteria bacterium]|nr:recombinase family protein [Deltaproteobacteria bacterium]